MMLLNAALTDLDQTEIWQNIKDESYYRKTSHESVFFLIVFLGLIAFNGEREIAFVLFVLQGIFCFDILLVNTNHTATQ